MTTRTITDVKVYWDSQKSQNEGWAYRASDDLGLIDTGSIDGIDDDDLDGAIDEAVHILDLDITADQFAREPNVDGGYAEWSEPQREGNTNTREIEMTKNEIRQLFLDHPEGCSCGSPDCPSIESAETGATYQEIFDNEMAIAEE